MGNPPESLMIFREELQKAKLEKERLRKEYQAKVSELTEDMSILKEKIASQEEMIRMAIHHAVKLEEKLDKFKKRIEQDEERNSSGFH